MERKEQEPPDDGTSKPHDETTDPACIAVLDAVWDRPEGTAEISKGAKRDEMSASTVILELYKHKQYGKGVNVLDAESCKRISSALLALRGIVSAIQVEEKLCGKNRIIATPSKLSQSQVLCCNVR